MIQLSLNPAAKQSASYAFTVCSHIPAPSVANANLTWYRKFSHRQKNNRSTDHGQFTNGLVSVLILTRHDANAPEPISYRHELA